MTNEELLADIVYEVTKRLLIDCDNLVGSLDLGRDWREHLYDRMINREEIGMRLNITLPPIKGMVDYEGLVPEDEVLGNCSIEFTSVDEFGFRSDHWYYTHSCHNHLNVWASHANPKTSTFSVDMKNITEELLRDSIQLCDIVEF